MRPPAVAPSNIRKPEASSAHRHALNHPPIAGGLLQFELPKEMVGPKKHRGDVLHAESKSKLWAPPARKAPTSDDLQKIGSQAIEEYIRKFYATVGK